MSKTFKNDIFNKDISEYDILQLEDWIRRCRTSIKKKNYKDSNDAEGDYRKAVLGFCEEWEKHYKKYEKIYLSEEFKKAILACGIKRDQIVFADKKGERYNLTEHIFFNLISKPESEDSLKAEFKKIREERFKKIENHYKFFTTYLPTLTIDNYRSKIEGEIKEKYQYTIAEFVSDEFGVEHPKMIPIEDKLLKEKNVGKLVEMIGKLEKSKLTIKSEATKFKIVNLLSKLYKYDIAKQQYYNYINKIGKNKKIINIEKKFFINLGLYLSLDVDSFEKLLRIHGYSFENSLEDRDLLLKSLVKKGMSKNYIDVIFENRGFYDIKKRECFDSRDNDYNRYYALSKESKLTPAQLKEFTKVKEALGKKVKAYLSDLDNKEKKLKEEIDKLEKAIDPDTGSISIEILQVNEEINLLKDDLKTATDKYKKVGETHNKRKAELSRKEKMTKDITEPELQELNKINKIVDRASNGVKYIQRKIEKNNNTISKLEESIKNSANKIKSLENEIFELKYQISEGKVKEKRHEPNKIFKFSYHYNLSDEDTAIDEFNPTYSKLEEFLKELER